MKRAFCLLAVLTLLAALPLAALAQAPAYAATAAFTGALDQSGIVYTVSGIADGNEIVTIGNIDEHFRYSVIVAFAEDEQHVSFRVWNLIALSESEAADAYRACNALNYSYRYTRFFVDESDWSVTVAYDLILDSAEDAATAGLEALDRLCGVIAGSYDTLAPFAQ